MFGFLCAENAALPGNVGLLDQYLALVWVNRNVGYFGGDTGKVKLRHTQVAVRKETLRHRPKKEETAHY